MDAYHVMAGEERLGPFSLEEIAGMIESGELSLEQHAWAEGMEDWMPISAILEQAGAAVHAVVEDEDGEIVEKALLEGPGFAITALHLVLGEEVWEWAAINKAEVEVEHTKRGKAIAGTIFFGVIGVILLALPLFHNLGEKALWIIWGVIALGCVVMFFRNASTAFRPTPTFLAVHLADGDDRIVPLSHRQARHACDAINARLKGSCPSEEA